MRLLLKLIPSIGALTLAAALLLATAHGGLYA